MTKYVLTVEVEQDLFLPPQVGDVVEGGPVATVIDWGGEVTHVRVEGDDA